MLKGLSLVLMTSLPLLAIADRAAAQTAGAADGAIAEVVVTAQKRTETVQKAPYAVTVLGSGDLQQQQIRNPMDLNNLVPSIHVGNYGTVGNLSIRGIGTTSAGGQGSTSVAILLDGVYIQPGLLPGMMFDLQSVEVAPGPQGTLYGRGAEGGVINLVANKPKQEFGAGLGVGVGNYELVNLEGYLNLPISDTLSTRFSIQSERHDAYSVNGYNDADFLGWRLQSLWKPSDKLSLGARVDYSHVGGKGFAPAPYPYTGDVYKAPALPPGQSFDNSNWSVSANLTYDLGGAVMTLLPAYNRFHQHVPKQNLLINGPQFGTEYKPETYSIDARLSSPAQSKLKWIAGLYGYEMSATYYLRQAVPGGVLTSQDYPYIKQHSYAAYAQATYPIRDNVRLTGGLRYSKDDAADRGRIYGGPANVDTGVFRSQAKFSDVAWKVGVDIDVAPASLVYGSVSTGYKPGGIYSGDAPSSYEAENVTHYEVGTKNRFLNGRLQINDALFYDHYTGFQSTQVGFLNPQAARITGQLFINAQSAYVFGNELSVIYLATPNDRFEVGLNYLQGEFKTFLIAATPVAAARDLSGNRLPYQATWSSNLGYAHIFRISNGGRIEAAANFHYSGAYETLLTNQAGTRQPAYHQTDLRMTYFSPDGRWSLQGYAKNLEDEHPVAYSISAGTAFYQAPRTYGLMLRANF